MNRLIFLLLCAFIALFQPFVSGQERTLLAEGDSIAQTTTGGIKPLTHWKLWRIDSGYEVIDVNVQNDSFIQIFRFDTKFMPIGFSKKMGPVELPKSRINLPKLPGAEISCEYKPKELVCGSSAPDNTQSIVSIDAVPPYVVVGEFYDLDFLWFMTGVVHLASKEKTGGLVNIYAITSGKGPKEIGLKADKPFRISSDGDGSAMALGRVQPIKKYLGSDGHSLIGTDQGIIVRVSPSSKPEVGFAIDNYKEYEPWGVPF